MPSSHMSPSDPVSPVLSTVQATHQPPFYYRLVISLLKPLYRIQVWRRSHKNDNYQQEVAQRFGKHYPPPPVSQANDQNCSDQTSLVKNSRMITNPQSVIWCHAVSLGETNTIAPLLDALLAKGYQIWLTNTTQTGFARGASRFANDIASGRLSHSYVPVDTPAVVETFLAHVEPIAALFVETELWANILSKLSEHKIPSILVNGRLSASSFKRYQKIEAVSTSMMENLTLIIAQDDESAKRFRQLGAQSAQIRVAGSLKWVINTPQITAKNPQATVEIEDKTKNKALKKESNVTSAANTERDALARPIWVAASTHSGEEAAALTLHTRLLAESALHKVLLIIVPRHPERFDEVATLIKASGLTMARRSLDEQITDQTQVYLADSMGELMHWYKLADVALVGGSLVDIGGHNPVEPASVGTPVLIGRYTQSCQSVVDKLASAGALYQPYNPYYQAIHKQDREALDDQTTDDTLIYEQLKLWLSETELALTAGKAGKTMTLEQQSVLTRQLSMIEEVIEEYSAIKA
ncbi:MULTISPECIES: 3-deoxy-D-manno-octulosonic acid transferase [unclassified Psychrobacter]|uniref:3-deoxy-D-manno-octulosonic acid transferase n=1 Tax=unclassified Psychrobacter TaxID=196806 RepID=UPI003FD31750